jgi:hypothetical protein
MKNGAYLLKVPLRSMAMIQIFIMPKQQLYRLVQCFSFEEKFTNPSSEKL